MKKKIQKLEMDCEGKCGKTVNWVVRDDNGKNPQIALSIQCGYCGKLNIERPKLKEI